jgi:hypothetical protein
MTAAFLGQHEIATKAVTDNTRERCHNRRAARCVCVPAPFEGPVASEDLAVASKTVKFNSKGIEKVAADRPALYKIQTEGGKTNYVGSPSADASRIA